MARTQLPNLALPRSPEDGLAGSGSAFDKQFPAGTCTVGIAGEGQDFGVMQKLLPYLSATCPDLLDIECHPRHRACPGARGYRRELRRAPE
jgi:hypothetical protein